MILRLLLLLCVFGGSAEIVCAERQLLPNEALIVLQRDYPEYEVGSGVVGNIITDDSDVAVYLYKKASKNSWPYIRIVVLTKGVDGKYKVLTESQSRVFNEKNETSLEIKRKSLFAYEREGGMDVSTSYTFQLRYESGDLRLVGVEYNSIYHGDEPESDYAKRVEYRISSNYLTGQEVMYNRKGIHDSRKEFQKITLRTLYSSFYGE